METNIPSTQNVGDDQPKRLTQQHLDILKQRTRVSLYHQPGSLFFDTVECATSNHDRPLTDEIKLLRATILEMLEKVNGTIGAAGTEGEGGQAQGQFDEEPITFKEKVVIVKQLTEAVGRLVKTEFEIQTSNVITVDAFRAWMGAFVREVKDMFPSQDDQMKFVKISRKIGEPKRG